MKSTIIIIILIQIILYTDMCKKKQEAMQGLSNHLHNSLATKSRVLWPKDQKLENEKHANN